jgi:hypothetical protein
MPSLQKENLIKKICKVILIVICVVIMRLLITCFLVVLLLKLHGESLQYASSSRTGFHPTPISGHGWGKPYRERGGGICACLGYLLYAELPGKPGTKSALVKFTSEVCVR